MAESATPAYITGLIRHFADHRDGTHGGSTTRKDKEAHFEKAVHLLAPVARQTYPFRSSPGVAWHLEFWEQSPET